MFRSTDSYDKEIQDTSVQSLESTKRMLQMIEEANEFGVQSLAYLEEQDEKLCHVQSAVSNIDEEMVDVKEDIRQMELLCVKIVAMDADVDHQVIANPMKMPFLGRFSEKPARRPYFRSVVKEQPRITLRTKHDYITESDYLPRLLNDAREEAMDSNLKSVDAFLENLRDIAIDMNAELNLQETKIDHINQLVINNDVAIDSNSKRLTKLSKK